MRMILPFLPIYATLITVFAYFIKHEKTHARIAVYLREICAKLGIKCEEKD